MAAHFDELDYLVFSALLIVSALIGVYFAYFAKKKQNTTSEYLLGGKTMGVFPISMSLIASYISGISVLGIPAEIYTYGTMYWLVSVSEGFVSLTMALLYIPVFYNLNITSSYEYLALRFNRKVQTLGSCLFILKMLLYIPIVIYVPALAFSQVTGINLHLITPIVCVICIFYTTVGGLKAVVWTDTIQMVVMVAGIATVLVIGLVNIGAGEVMRRNLDTNRIEFDVFDPNPTVRHTVWSLVIGNYFYWLASCSVNQSLVQRCLSMSSKREAKSAVFILAGGIFVLVSMCSCTGLVIFAYFHDCDPLVTKKITKSDQILPYFVMEISEKIPGLPGLFVSGVLSAALSTMSTGLNSISGVIYQDIVRPIVKNNVSEATASFVMKIIVATVGALCVAMVFIVEHLGGLIQAGKSLSGITAGPLLGLFTLGMFFPWANSNGAMIGGICSLVAVSSLSIMSQTAIANGRIYFEKKPVSVEGCSYDYENYTQVFLTRSEPTESVHWILRISYLWYTMIGTITVLLTGMLASYFTGFNDIKTVDPALLTPAIRRFIPRNEKENHHFQGSVNKMNSPMKESKL